MISLQENYYRPIIFSLRQRYFKIQLPPSCNYVPIFLSNMHDPLHVQSIITNHMTLNQPTNQPTIDTSSNKTHIYVLNVNQKHPLLQDPPYQRSLTTSESDNIKNMSKHITEATYSDPDNHSPIQMREQTMVDGQLEFIPRTLKEAHNEEFFPKWKDAIHDEIYGNLIANNCFSKQIYTKNLFRKMHSLLK